MGTLEVSTVLAGLAVRDLDIAAEWTSRLLGRPADARPMEGLATGTCPPRPRPPVRRQHLLEGEFGQLSDPDGNSVTIVEARPGFNPAASH